MIFCSSDVYAKVWGVDKAEKYLEVKFSTSEKQQDGTYRYSKWFGRFIGHAFNALKDTLKEGDKIKITKCKMTNEGYTDKEGNKKFSFRLVVMEAELEGQSEQPTQTPTAPVETREQPPVTETEDSPW